MKSSTNRIFVFGKKYIVYFTREEIYFRRGKKKIG